MNRLADERLARDDRAVAARMAIDARNLQPAGVAAADDLRALAGTVEVDAAHLEAVAHLPDAVEDQPMTLIAIRERALTAQILRDRERHLGESADRLRILIPEAGQRVGERPLPAVAHALGDVRLQTVVVGLAGVRNHPDHAVERERAAADVRIGIRECRWPDRT